MDTNLNVGSAQQYMPTQELSLQEFINLQHGEARARAIIWAWGIFNDMVEIPELRPPINVGQRNFNFRLSINRMESIIRDYDKEEKRI
jgi:hypothetical protein